jgi:hypothetical protein
LRVDRDSNPFFGRISSVTIPHRPASNVYPPTIQELTLVKVEAGSMQQCVAMAKLAPAHSRGRAMTKDDLVKEMRLLLGFAKIATLDLGDAYWRVWTWLNSVTSDPERLAWMTRIDAYRVLSDAGPTRPAPTANGPDPLGSRVLHDLSNWQRAYLFLVGPAGFSPEIAREILTPKRRPATHTRMNLSAVSHGRVDPHQGRRHP